MQDVWLLYSFNIIYLSQKKILGHPNISEARKKRQNTFISYKIACGCRPWLVIIRLKKLIRKTNPYEPVSFSSNVTSFYNATRLGIIFMMIRLELEPTYTSIIWYGGDYIFKARWTLMPYFCLFRCITCSA